MTVKILKPEVLTSAGFAKLGDVVELPDVEAKRLIDKSFAELSPAFVDKRVSWPKLNRKLAAGAVVIR